MINYSLGFENRLLGQGSYGISSLFEKIICVDLFAKELIYLKAYINSFAERERERKHTIIPG
jgi:hypothetical protein